jgi:hypothetical protein
MIISLASACKLQHHYLCFVASTCCGTTSSFLLLSPILLQHHYICHLCCFYLQHHFLFSVAFACCSTIVSSLLRQRVVASLCQLCQFHPLQRHFLFSVASACCSSTASSMLLLLAARAPLHLHPWCFHLLQRRCVISSNSTCYRVIVLSLLHPPAAAPCTAFPLLLCVFKHVYTVQLYSST